MGVTKMGAIPCAWVQRLFHQPTYNSFLEDSLLVSWHLLKFLKSPWGLIQWSWWWLEKAGKTTELSPTPHIRKGDGNRLVLSV
jgi:hypothetical protein